MDQNQESTPFRDVTKELSGYIGTGYYIQHFATCYVFSEGINALRKLHECFWLIDDILLETAGNASLTEQDFIKWTLARTLSMQDGIVTERTSRFTLTAADENDTILFEKEISYSDFQGDCVQLYFTDGALLLPSEYYASRNVQ